MKKSFSFIYKAGSWNPAGTYLFKAGIETLEQVVKYAQSL